MKGEKDERTLSRAISALAAELCGYRQERKTEFEWVRSTYGLATKADLKEMECRIMSKISEFAAEQKRFNAEHGAAIDSAVASVTALTGDVAELNRLITELQNSPGGITPEDQTLLDELQAEGKSLAERSTALAAALKTLDEATPPVVPPVV